MTRFIYILIPYTLCMALFLRDIWFTRNEINSTHSLVVWDDMVILRYVCLFAGALFAILTVLSLIHRHRSFMMLWLGTVVISSLLLLIPCGPTEAEPWHPILSLMSGLVAHVSLVLIHDRLLPRSWHQR